MAVDADAYLESLEPPALTIGGTTYQGQFLSLEEWLPFESKFVTLSKMVVEDFDLNFWRKLVLDFCLLAFPPRWRDVLNPWHKTVGQLVLTLPPVLQMKVMKDFFESQQRGIGTAEGEA